MIGLTLLLAIVGLEPPDQSSSPRIRYQETHETVRSHGKSIGIDVFAPAIAEKKPAVIVIHGNGRSGEQYLPATHEEARRLAEAGYVAIVPHYFDRAKPDPKNGLKNARSYAQWSQTIRDVVGYAAKRDDVDPSKIGILGSSLGGWVAISAAGKDRRVRCVVEVFGGFPEGEGLNPENFPPTLILHGEDDKVVSVDEAYKLDDLLTRAGVDHEMHIYPGTGHGFRGEVREDGIRRTLTFFAEQFQRDSGEALVRPKGQRKPRKS